MAIMMKSITQTPADSIDAAALIIVVIPPTFVIPKAKSSAQQIRATVDVNTLPIPSYTAFVLPIESFTPRVVMRSTTKDTRMEIMMAV